MFECRQGYFYILFNLKRASSTYRNHIAISYGVPIKCQSHVRRTSSRSHGLYGHYGLFGDCTASKTSAIFLPKIGQKSGATTCLTTFVTKKLSAIRLFGTLRFLFYAKSRRFSALENRRFSFSIGFFFAYCVVIFDKCLNTCGDFYDVIAWFSLDKKTDTPFGVPVLGLRILIRARNYSSTVSTAFPTKIAIMIMLMPCIITLNAMM